MLALTLGTPAEFIADIRPDTFDGPVIGATVEWKGFVSSKGLISDWEFW